MQRIAGIVLIFLIGALAVAAGCSSTTDSGTSTATTTTAASTTAVATTTVSLSPGPTEVPETYKVVNFDIEKNSITAVITVDFRGGKGQSMVSGIDVKVTLSNGEVVTGTLTNSIGDTLEVQGTNGTDRVEITVSYTDGTSYKVVDELVVFKSRQ